MKFLIIDDNPADQKVIGWILQKEFCDSEFVNVINHKDFDEAITRCDYDAIIIEYCLDWADGMLIFKRIKERLPYVPVVMVSSTRNDEIIGKEMKSGLSNFILRKHLYCLPAIIKERIERVRLLKMYDETNQKYHSLMNETSEVIALFDTEGNLWEVSKTAEKLTGYMKEELTRMNLVQLFPKEEIDKVVTTFKEGIQKGSWALKNIHIQKKDGRNVSVDITGSMIEYSDKREMLAIIRDITERQRIEGELKILYDSVEKRVEERTRTLANANEELQIIIAERKQTEEALRRRIDFEKTVASISTKFIILSDFNNAIFKSLADAGQLSKASRAYLFQFRDNGNVMGITHEWCSTGVKPEFQHLQNLHSTMFPWLMLNLHAGNIIHIADVSKMSPDASAEKEEFEREGIKAILILPVYAENELAGFIGFDNVVTTGAWQEEDVARLRIMAEIIGNAIARKKAETLITHMAYHDSLTNLPNRNLFYDRLQVALVQAKRNERTVVVMTLDLDNFKTINDTLGHHVGDLLLKAVAEIMTKCIRECDTVARTGGDEFTIILPEISHPLNAAIVANKILYALSHPFLLEGHKIHTTISIGISLYPLDAHDIENLIKKADIAMYLAKEQGKNTYRFSKPDMNTHV